MDKLINEIFKDLSIELDIPDEEGSMLLSKVRSAYREVKGARSYPMDYEDDFICTLDTGAPVFEKVTLTPNPVDCGKTFIISVKVTD